MRKAARWALKLRSAFAREPEFSARELRRIMKGFRRRLLELQRVDADPLFKRAVDAGGKVQMPLGRRPARTGSKVQGFKGSRVHRGSLVLNQSELLNS
jgi:hypothetical protein